MTQTLFFYDLETTGLNSREDRIMQFAGQRTDLELRPIGEPFNLLVRLNDDTLPSPEALMVTCISPQKTVDEGYTEAEFAKILMNEVFTPDTVAVGFNNVRFDDEFIRHLFWRNFYDPYEWTWKDGRSRWDLLDVVRMTRALRPDGIEWPMDGDKPVNKLERITKENKIDHLQAHDALSDVVALIRVSELIKQKQPDLYRYLFSMRDKKEVKKLVNLDDKRPFVYTSGRYDNDFLKTTVAMPLTSGPNSNVIVYDLRYDPAPFIAMDNKELAALLFATYEERMADGFTRVPVKQLQYNRVPAIAPMGVLGQVEGWQKIGLDKDTVEKHKKTLLFSPHFAENIRSLFENRPGFPAAADVEAQLYDGFVSDRDRMRIDTIRSANESTLADMQPEFSDERLTPLLLHYKARNFPRTLSETEVLQWEEWRSGRLQRQLPGFIASLTKLQAEKAGDTNADYILSEMQLWVESVLPAED